MNDILVTANFSDVEQLKWADLKLIHKSDSRTDKENCRHVSILPNISKIYKGCLSANQAIILIQVSLSFLLPMIENVMSTLAKVEPLALLTNLFKAFNCFMVDL